MTEFTWTLQGSDGKDLRTSEGFVSKEDAEAWMGAEWSSLKDEGGEFVVLKRGDEVLYRMSLAEA